MVYCGMQLLVLVHSHKGVFTDKVKSDYKQVVSPGGKLCLVCDFLFKKLPEKQVQHSVFQWGTLFLLIFPWTLLLQQLYLAAILLRKSGRAPPPFFYF